MDALLIILLLGLLVLAYWDIGWWKWFWMAMVVLLGGFEGVAVLVTGYTLSQQFWEFHAEHTVMGWVAIGMTILAFGVVVYHLACKKIKR